jgi:hypothetical protein
MTEAEWLASTNSTRMLQFLSRPTRERKMALFCVACCRRLGGLLTDPYSVEALNSLERFAEGYKTMEELAVVGQAAEDVTVQMVRALFPLEQQDASAERRYWAASAVNNAISSALRTIPEPVIVRGINLVREGVRDPLSTPETMAVDCQKALRDWNDYDVEVSRLPETRFQAAALRCIVGNCFRPAHIDPAVLQWRAGNRRVVASLATAAYEERLMPNGELDNARLAVLADALEDVGCTAHEILEHLRGPGVHVRGCWALDILMLNE